MATDPTNWWPAWEKFVFSLAGAIAGGSLVAWLSGYYSEKGKRKLIAEEFPKLLEQARATAYEEQKGKNLATKEDIQQVVDQVRAVTRETEAIKAEIQNNIWNRQRVLDLKYQAFQSAVSAINQYAADAMDARLQFEKKSYAGRTRDVLARPETDLAMDNALCFVGAFFSPEAYRLYDEALRTEISIETAPNSKFYMAREAATKLMAEELQRLFPTEK